MSYFKKERDFVDKWKASYENLSLEALEIIYKGLPEYTVDNNDYELYCKKRAVAELLLDRRPFVYTPEVT